MGLAWDNLDGTNMIAASACFDLPRYAMLAAEY